MRLCAAIVSIALISSLASCKTQKNVTDTNVMESVFNRVRYDHSMDVLGVIKSKSSVKNITASAVIGRKIVVYDTSLAVRDSATGEWTAPVLYTIEEDGKTESETSEQSTTVEQDSLTSVTETICITDSAGYEKHETIVEKKKEAFGWRSRLWVVICLSLIIAIILLWKFATTLK